jgi:hypothetical protein
VSRKRKIRIAWCRGPRVKGKRDLRGNLPHVLTNVFLSNLCTVSYLIANETAMGYILIGKRWTAELEEAAKLAGLDQAEGLEVREHQQRMHNNTKTCLPRLHK